MMHTQTDHVPPLSARGGRVQTANGHVFIPKRDMALKSNTLNMIGAKRDSNGTSKDQFKDDCFDLVDLS